MEKVSLLKRIWRATYIKGKKNWAEKRYNHYWRQHTVCYGSENKNNHYFIVRRREMYIGLFSHFIVYVNDVKKALDNAYIPVIDMQNSYNIYLKDEEIGKVNAWEFYFKQPCGCSLEDIKRSKSVTWGSGFVTDMFPYKDVGYLLGKYGDFYKYKEVVRQYFDFSDEATKQINGFFDKYMSGRNVLGVLCRGTDYISGKPYGHPIQPTNEQIKAKIDEVLKQYDCDTIFVGTEDVGIYKFLKLNYRDLIITNREKFLEYAGEASIGKLIKTNERDVKKEGMDYLITIALLSRCSYFVGGNTSGTVGVMLLNDGFEYTYIFDLGLYT